MKKGFGLISLLVSTLTLLLIIVAGNVHKVDFTRMELVKGYLKADTTKELSYFSSYFPIADPEPFWNLTDRFGTATQPSIAGETGVLVELDTGKVVFDKAADQKMKIASLTKIMTAVVALEHLDPNTKVTVTPEAAAVGENSMGISAGEVYTVEELLYGLLLASGNDAAYAIAFAAAGNPEQFVKWMNIKAEELGLKNTKFYDPSGLDDKTYSTAIDLVKVSRYALKSKLFREIVRTSVYELQHTDQHKYIYLENQTNLLTTYPGVRGIKTGYTEEAGLCLVTYASNGGKELVGTVLNSIDRKGDMILMLDHGFSTLGVVVEHHLLD